jgi:DNA-binding response OmpR family regulator
MPKLLVVEDEKAIQEAIEKSFTLEPTFRCHFESDPTKVLAKAVSLKPDLVLLDIKLPGGDGRQLIKSLKENDATRDIPVIFLTGMSSEGDRVLGLNLGADDYVVKPFGAIELIARIKAVLRRTTPKEPAEKKVRVQDLEVDPKNRVATLKGKRLHLQPREFDVLVLLVSHSGKTLSRQFLIENTSSYEADVASRSLDTHIKNLRKKLGPMGNCIETFPKTGYAWMPDR